MKCGSALLVYTPAKRGAQFTWYSLLTSQCTSNTTIVSTPSARQRAPISRWPSMAACRQPLCGPSSSDRYSDGTWVTLAASASVPMVSGSPLRDRVRAQAHAHVLGLEEHLVTPRAAFAADPARLRAAERLSQ